MNWEHAEFFFSQKTKTHIITTHLYFSFVGIPTNVSLSMFIEGMSSFSAQTMDYHLDMYFQQEWHDHRLEHNNSAPILVKDKKVFGEMWHPDVYFANAKSASFQVSLITGTPLKINSVLQR
ncbi:hypothetical protein ANCCAN_05269 [Ancylostoma caninum]|uniref:Neurotransmitter-gated ion-channel ligand-binding domain-containing protein n=1 Tax=Ancylostoma caninum TaxID=29170 RepID=A0A368H057_ANCCA|nr:hypothetical protein ANCCAN_05269 [Ancylostoma caninum]